MSDRPLAERLDQAINGMLGEMPAVGNPTPSTEPTLSALMEIAGSLRNMPDDAFKTRLGRELQAESERRPHMTASTSEFAAIRTITPFISVPEGALLVEFMKHTFGAEETGRHPHHGPDGFIVGMRIGDSDLLIMGGEAVRGHECPAALHVYVKDCDATYRRALDAGAVPIAGVGAPADRPYGERAAFVSDAFGNTWFIATRLGPDYIGAGLGQVTPNLLPTNAPRLIDFLKGAFGANVASLHEEAGRLLYASVRIGEAIVEISPVEQERSRPFGFYIHTDDVDAVYHRALAAGAISILPPADQPFGDRLAIVADQFGNRWFAAKRIVAE